MHTLPLGDNISIAHNGDWSGDIVITVQDHLTAVDNLDQVHITLPEEAWHTLVAEYLRSRIITNIENMSDDELIGSVSLAT